MGDCLRYEREDGSTSWASDRGHRVSCGRRSSVAVGVAAAASGAKLLHTARLRADTTVIPANMDRRRAAGRRVREIAVRLRARGELAREERRRHPHHPARPSNTAAPSVGWSNGEPDAKAGSAASSACTAGTGLAWTARPGPPSGRTQGLRPQPGQDQHPGQLTPPDKDAKILPRLSPLTFQGEVVRAGALSSWPRPTPRRRAPCPGP
jgi:hypothetical protein